jgi:hypothetical protein
MGNELGPIVHSQMGGFWILIEKFLNRVDHIDGLASPPNTNSQAPATVLIHNIEQFQSASIYRLVELEVDCPHVVRVLGSE